MVLELLAANTACVPVDLLVLNVAMASFNGLLAFVAFSQLIRIHLRSQQDGWTRQKALHLMIGSSNLGNMIYFIFALVAIFELWHCWSHVFGFVLMAFPKILFLAAFLLLLSFWVDLCHQANDEEDDDDDDDEENNTRQALLENSKNKPGSSNVDGHRRCCGFPAIHLGSRQKFVIVVVMLVFFLTVAVSILIWIGAGKNPIDSTAVARVYEYFIAVTVLLSGGALGFYGFMLFYRLKKVRSEEASSEMKKVGGLAVVCVVCFTSSALVDLLTDIPLSYNWRFKRTNGVKALVLLILYFSMGSLIPSAFLLWIMRELPPPKKIQRQEESRAIAFISHGAADVNPQGWTAVTRSKNQHNPQTSTQKADENTFGQAKLRIIN